MNRNYLNNELNHFLEPGGIIACWEEYCIATVLGSCVSVCLWDRKNKTGGMNHFVFPDKFSDIKPAKCGNYSTRHLIKMMQDIGSNKANLQAHVIGGASSSKHSDFEVGRKNVAMAKKILRENNIRIINEDTGGNFGRKVVFDTSSGEIMVYKVNELRENDWNDYKSTNNR